MTPLFLLTAALICEAQTPQSVEAAGVKVDLSLRPLGQAATLTAGQPVEATLTVRDARSGAPLGGLHPKAWMLARPSEMVSAETGCAEKIRPLLAGQMAGRAEVDFNSFLLLTLNHDRSISIINPQVSFTRTKLESMIPLPGIGQDWALSGDGHLLLVTLPAERLVAVIDTRTRKVTGTIPTGPDGEPMRLLLPPGSRTAWVALDGASALLAIDTETRTVEARIPVGAGRHTLAATPDGQFLYVTNSGDGTVTAIDAPKRKPIRTLPVGQTPVPLAYGAASGLMATAGVNDGVVTLIDPARHEVVGRLPLAPGITQLAFEPKGRFLWALNQVAGRLTVIDSATREIVGEANVLNEPDQILFSDHYAYVRRLGSEKVSMFSLDRLGQGPLSVVEVGLGRGPATEQPEQIGVASMGAIAPNRNALLMANAADRTIYYYAEGMMAPMGTFSTYGRTPRGLLILDRSLNEISRGVFRAVVQLPAGGSFDMPVVLDNPQLTHCFAAQVEGPAETTRTSVSRIRGGELLTAKSVTARERTTIRFTITDRARQNITGVSDVDVLLFEPPGVHRVKARAKPTADGKYEAEVTLPSAGRYKLLVSAVSQSAAMPLPLADLEAGGGQ